MGRAVREPSVFGNEILTILLALGIKLFYIHRVTNVSKTVNSPALSDTCVTCSQVLRYFESRNLLAGGREWSWLLEGYIIRLLFTMFVWITFILRYINASAKRMVLNNVCWDFSIFK